MRTYRAPAKALPCQSRADVSDGSEGFALSKPYGRIGQERRLCRVKAVRTMAKAEPRQSRADVSDGNEGFAVSKPCGW